MVATLRVMLDQVVSPTDPDLATASRELARALVGAAPSGCEVEGVVPAVPPARLDEVAAALPGIARLHRVVLGRRELAAAVQLGVASGVGAGMLHSPTLLAPIVRHDRVHDHDQTVVTVWDVGPWEAPGEHSRAAVSWHRAMLKRAAKHADAVIVPTHAMARTQPLAALGDRVRVIAGAPPAGFAVPVDEIGRRRSMSLPEGYVLLTGSTAPSHALATGFAAVAHAGLELPVVVIDAPEGEEPAIAELAAASGIPERLVHVRGALDDPDRAAIFAAALTLLAPSRRSAYPWRVGEALALGVPVVAAASPVHREVVVDGGLLVGDENGADGTDAAALGAALAEALSSTASAERLAVLAADRSRAFSWRDAADRVWQLHAEL